jgi:hypothetical protein
MTEHEQNLIDQYNRNRPHSEWVYTIEELNRKVLNQEIEHLRKDSNGIDHDHD